MRMKFRAFAVIYLLAAAWCGVAVYDVDAILALQKLIRSGGMLKKVGVEVYWDENLTRIVYELDWGWVEPGEVLNVTVWILNTGNYPKTILSMSTSNWSPPMVDEFIYMTWDREGWQLDKSGPLNATLTLHVDPGAVTFTYFLFDIEITAEG